MFPETKEDFLTLTKKANLIPIYKEYSSALETPLAVFLKLKSNKHAFLLESVERGVQMGRFSFVGFEPRAIFKAKDKEISIEEQGEITNYTCLDPLKEIEGIFQKYIALSVPELPMFSGGAVGYFGYDMIRNWEDIPKGNIKDTDYPDCLLMFTDQLIIFDHVKQTMKIVINVHVGNNPEEQYLEALQKIEIIKAKLDRPIPKDKLQKNKQKEELDFQENTTPEEFKEKVKKAKKYIESGDIFQVVISRKIDFELKTDPLLIYQSLRSLNPSPYMFYLDFADIKLVGSSPEIMVKVENNRAELRPIAGTRPRGKTAEEDSVLIEDLLADEKEKAEHLMLVDLGRNDLGRVSQYGTVKVEEFMKVEKYSHVSHLVSKVTGKLKEGSNCFDVLRASFPAGTVSGAPKIRAMQIIDELEGEARGPYAGAVGSLGYNGNLDTCITIRTLMINKNRATIQAGAGIVADSNPVNEYLETCNKKGAILKAIEIATKGEED
ncbi:anthranilate synthase component 1 [Desulfonispora thiosulfatigenes DSM 11270]|uniref:Anthranilate synthase component 1 n=1 Tax=Desulfonispora thiosulfatigenes DSM 11270 TaxID=656914 RepID=A0A1W1VA56_DESTI|nr:anthranilate synthase component I [Desulfonispora thiosulfatigenes]SMB90367.1 anthranilate synthase component 1 [Desulfonispora thiosulfatigenes DSM 11270]